MHQVSNRQGIASTIKFYVCIRAMKPPFYEYLKYVYLIFTSTYFFEVFFYDRNCSQKQNFQFLEQKIADIRVSLVWN